MDKNILETVHEVAKGLHTSGVMKQNTMRDFDVLCLPEIQQFSAIEIKWLRLKNRASQ